LLSYIYTYHGQTSAQNLGRVFNSRSGCMCAPCSLVAFLGMRLFSTYSLFGSSEPEPITIKFYS